MQKIRQSQNSANIHLLCNVLNENGIPARVLNDVLSTAKGAIPFGECYAELWVGDRDVERAKKLLRDFEA